MNPIHMCLVSSQPIPNLIPINMNELRPRKVALLVSSDMQIQAERLERIIRGMGIKVIKYDIAPYDLESARDTCMNILAQFENEEVILNITGGTKIMALAAFEVFREMEKTIIYVDTQNKSIQVLSPKSQSITSKGLVKVKVYLEAYGQNVIKDRTNPERAKLHEPAINSLVQNFDKFRNAIKTLNKYAAPLRRARTFPLQVPIAEQDRQTPGFNELAALFQEHQIINLKDNGMEFTDLADVEFASGGWLEEYVFYVASKLPITDLRMGIEVKWDQRGPKPPENEYDVLFTHNNRLYLVECKTKRFEGSDREDFNNDLIYKLESLKDAAGGLYGNGMLVSYQKLTEAQKRRLKANRLEFCDGSDLNKLKERMRQWIE